MEGLGSFLRSRENVKILIAGLVAAAVALYVVKRFFEEVVKWHAWSQLPAPQDKAHPLLGNFKEWSKPGKRKQGGFSARRAAEQFWQPCDQ